jgi:WD40 repeat protein
VAIWLGAGAAVATAAVFSPSPGSPVSVGQDPISVAASADGKYVAVANLDDHTLSVFSVGATGALSQLGGSPIATGTGPQSVAFSATAPILAVANAGDSTLSEYLIGGDTVVSIGTESTVADGHGTGPSSVAFSPDGALIATADSDGYVSLLRTGGLSMMTGYPHAVNLDAISLAWSPNGILATANRSPADSVSLYSIAQDGTWNGELSISPLGTGAGSNPRKVAFSQDGSLVAAADRDSGQISERSTVTGAPVTGSPYSAGAGISPDAVSYSRSGLLAVGTTNGTALVYSVGAGGVLTAVAGSPYTVDSTSPTPSVAFSAAGGVLAAVDENNDKLAVLTVGPPAAAIGVPADGSIYDPGEGVDAGYSCRDALDAPGLSSCSGPVAAGSPLTTSAIGTHAFTVTATSADGQTATATSSYTVQAPKARLSVSPSEAGTQTKPTPVSVEVEWLAANAGVVPNSYRVDLPEGMEVSQAGFTACSPLQVGSLASCEKSALATGEMTVRVASSPAVDCKFDLQLVGNGKTDLTLTAQPLSENAAGCTPGLDSTRVTSRSAGSDHHTQLSFELPAALTGAPSPPGFSFARTPSAISLDFGISGTKSHPVSFLSTVKCPSAGKWSATVTNSTPGAPFSPSASDTTACQAHSVDKSKAKALGSFKLAGLLKGKGGKGGGQPSTSKVVTGAVVHTIAAADAFVLADGSGQLYTIHGPGTLPPLGTQMHIGLAPLSDGQWVQTCVGTGTKIASSAVLQGVVAAENANANVFVLTAAGTSIPIARSSSAKLPQLFHHVTVKVDITSSGLVERKLRGAQKFNGLLGIVGVVKKVGRRGNVAVVSAADDGSTVAGTYTIPTGLSTATVKAAVGEEVEFHISISDGVFGGGGWPRGKDSGQLDLGKTIKGVQLRNQGTKSTLTLDQWQQSFSAAAGLGCRR